MELTTTKRKPRTSGQKGRPMARRTGDDLPDVVKMMNDALNKIERDGIGDASLAELARLLKYSRTAIRNIYHQWRKIPSPVLLELCLFVGITDPREIGALYKNQLKPLPIPPAKNPRPRIKKEAK
jgi:hypothetical protein